MLDGEACTKLPWNMITEPGLPVGATMPRPAAPAASATNRVTGELALDEVPRAVTVAGGSVWVTTDESLLRIDPKLLAFQLAFSTQHLVAKHHTDGALHSRFDTFVGECRGPVGGAAGERPERP